MGKWKSIKINENLIKYQTKKSTKIALPHNCGYYGYVLWISNKLINDNEIIYTDEFTFKLIKYGQDRFNYKKIIDEKNITAKEFVSIFSNVDNALEEIPLIHTPPNLKPIKVEVLEELKDG